MTEPIDVAILCTSVCLMLLFIRWLLLDFKREFELEDSIRLFEILCSQYLELNSDKAMVETDKALNKYFENDRKLYFN